ncbi:MAG: protein kinase, partial [Elusimicrobiota bacterium]
AIEDARKALSRNPNDRTAFSLVKLSEGRVKTVPDFEKTQTRLADSIEREYHGMVQQLNQLEERRLAPPEQLLPDGVRRLTSSAAAKLSVKDYWGAHDDAEKALELYTSNTQALYYLSVSHNLIGEYAEAANDATRALALAPRDGALRDARAWAYNRMGRVQEAIADAQHAIEIDPRDAYAFANRAYANEQRGDFPAMAEDYRAAAKINPQFLPAYRDAARRHGMTPQPLSGGKSGVSAIERVPAKVRSFAAVLFSSLFGGLLIALGVLHVIAGIKEQRAARNVPAPTGLEASYEIGKAIGQGGMGVVYEAVDRKLRRPVAIKMLRDEFKLDDAAKARFLEEARTVAELSHPIIVDIHAIVEDERGVSLVFERLAGRALDLVLAERGRLKLPEIKRILQSVCDGLAYAHAHDVIHRDLKPSNVMLLDDGGVKLLDFGISRHAANASSKPATQTVTGTPHYMAPEQEYGAVRKESDVFSLGAVLYEMLTGNRPFEGSAQAKLAKAYHRPSHFVPGISLELESLIDRALEPDPEKRIASPAEFWRQLDAVREA